MQWMLKDKSHTDTTLRRERAVDVELTTGIKQDQGQIQCSTML